MRIFALELNNDIKGLRKRRAYIESLIAQLERPDLVLLPELALTSYIPNHKIWEHADNLSKNTSLWAKELAKEYNCFIGIGYADYDQGHFYNRYLIADKDQVYGIVTKSEAEAAVFKRGNFDNIIKTPFGNVAVAICYDSRRKHFYKNIKDEKLSLIIFPHGSPADPKKSLEESKTNDHLCNLYQEAFNVPVIYINSYGKLEYMPGMMGYLMKISSFTMNGKSKIYTNTKERITTNNKETIGIDITLQENIRKKDITFYGNDISKGNFFFRNIILKPDVYFGIKKYNKLINKNN